MNERGSWWMCMALAGLAGLAGPAHADIELVVNGGFESGDFTGWTGIGETAFNGVQCPGPNPGVHAGSCSAYFGPFDSTGGIAQAIDVGSAGVPWNLSFAFQADGGDPSSLSVLFSGQTLLSLIDAAAGDFTLYDFSGVSNTATETLAFSFLDPPGFLSLDAVSLTVPEPSSIGLLSAGPGALIVRRRSKKAS